ncbi:Sensor histidine kinase ResE [uncultured Leptotrichia sp.]|uniref:sensor histidine kinase n=1 Tax=uncultured Leptotrichia sp. TaxID=159271 RepID=UPI001A5BD055|nr:HAMP domain-containing sensor histidine kinase [uncultured Leptotrichia sp.]VTX60133.1 Sensor histidine kinase ResE [uncultured Leptotrichia sp.]
MKNILKLIRRFVITIILSIFLLLFLNIFLFEFIFFKYSTDDSPSDKTFEIAKMIKFKDRKYFLPDKEISNLKKQNIWAIVIDNDSKKVIWQTENLPSEIPKEYSVFDIALFSHAYIKGYPVFTAKIRNDLLVLGYPKDSYWKYSTATWNYRLIQNVPNFFLTFLISNIFFVFLIYIFSNSKLLKSVNPIIKGIQNLPKDNPVNIDEKGVLSELAKSINKTSEILQNQREQLRNKDTARANWIAGVSHDIRTPLSMIMGYASQLKTSSNLSEEMAKKLSVILKQSERIKNLINDLNLASKLEYNMQPFEKKKENAVAVVRQVIVDFLNMDIDEKFPIEWKTKNEFISCFVNVDKNLIKRALENLIQNSINHNENGCTIYVSVKEDEKNCIICVEDNGIGVSDEELEKLNNTPHYMVCDKNTTEQQHGLGLLIVKQIMDVHNGQVEMKHSEYGGFKVVLQIPEM